MDWNVLFPNIGRRGYLVHYLRKTEKFSGKIFVSDCDRTASGLYGENDGHFILPKPVQDKNGYIHALIELCKAEKIRIIIPIIDPDIQVLSEFVDIFERNKIFVLVSDKATIETCYNKIKTNEFLSVHKFFAPQTYTDIQTFLAAYRRGEICFPVMLKPIYGSGSISTMKVVSMVALEGLFEDGLIIQEYIDGEEYGIDVFNDLYGQPVRCVIKKKLAMRSGETDKAITVKEEAIQRLAVRLAESLGHIGNLDCDLIKRDNRLYPIDLNPRFGGGYPATHLSGVNLLHLALELAQEKRISPVFNNYQENIVVMKEISVRSVRL